MLQQERICHCNCHKEGLVVMHCFPCCDFCGETYLNFDGSLKYNPYDKKSKEDYLKIAKELKLKKNE